MKILAVDDDPNALALVETTLRCAGYTDVSTASSTLMAMGRIAAAAQPFECFLLDIQMPGTDGIELCRQVRQIAAHERTPILMITAETDRTSMDRAFAAGATDYVNKPFDPMELVVRIGLAEHSCQQEAAVQAGLGQIDFLRSRSGIAEHIDIDDAFGVDGGSSVVSALELENYVLRMPRVQAWRSRSLTMQIESIEGIHATLSSEAFYDLVADVGDAIAAALKPVPHVVGYIGAGTFVAILHGASRLTAEAMGDEIRVQTHAMRLVLGPAGMQPVTVSVEPVMPIGAVQPVLARRSSLARHQSGRAPRQRPARPSVATE